MWRCATWTGRAGLVLTALVTFAGGAAGQEPAFPSFRGQPLAGWTGPVFELSQDYPSSLPAAGSQPWKQHDFETQSAAYLQSVLGYVLEGNVEVDWRVQQNPVRAWYHAPWMHAGENGREFVRGLTRERTSHPRVLHPRQATDVANFAVSVYNARGGYVIGRVWRDPENPDPSLARFPEGTVAAKLLFTTATSAQVPYLRKAFRWRAHVNRENGAARPIQYVRLLQIDVAVRDSRANATTGWVFGTFVYDGYASGASPWERMVPVGLMWGNDPELTPERYEDGERPRQSVVLNPTVGVPLRLGWLGRLNGPVDNPRSACLSCHATAQLETRSPMVPPTRLSDAEKLRWFRNVKAAQAFDAGEQSLDYSLQLQEGIRRFRDSRGR